MRVRAKGTRHRQPGSRRRKDCWARVSVDPLTQVQTWCCCSSVVCGFKFASELELSGEAGRLPGWERWEGVRGGYILGLGGVASLASGCGRGVRLGWWWGRVKETFEGPHYPQGAAGPSRREWQSHLTLVSDFEVFSFLFWGPSRWYTEACWHLTSQRQKKLLWASQRGTKVTVRKWLNPWKGRAATVNAETDRGGNNP